MGIKEDIDLLEGKISRLKVEYEQYFMRVLKREPSQLRDEVERLFLAYSNKAITNTSAKFKYNSLVAKYASYKQYWTRVLRSIDEGTYQRRAEGAFFSSTENAGAGGPPVENHRRPPADQSRAERNGKDAELKDFYGKYMEARRSCNEPTEGITYDALSKTIDQYRKKVEEQYKTKDIDLKVTIKDGKTKITITPKGKV